MFLDLIAAFKKKAPNLHANSCYRVTVPVTFYSRKKRRVQVLSDMEVLFDEDKSVVSVNVRFLQLLGINQGELEIQYGHEC